MEIGASPLFRGISEESQQAMRTCFDMREVSFRADEVIYDFGAGRNMVGVLAEGAAVIERIEGGKILEDTAPFWSGWRAAACSGRC